jgi:ATP-dependent RNA helicase DDX5/DBP2
VPHQTLLFSATMPKEIEALAAQYLNNPVKVKIGRVSVPTANVAQNLQRCGDGEKVELLVSLLQDQMEQAASGGPPLPLTIVFVERKNRCNEVAAALQEEGVPAVALHGGLSQVCMARCCAACMCMAMHAAEARHPSRTASNL